MSDPRRSVRIPVPPANNDSGANPATANPPQKRTRKPSMKPWLTLQCEDGAAITVPDDWTDKLGALIELLDAEYGGEFGRDNPVLIEAAERDCRIQTWHSFTKADIEGEGVDWDNDAGTFYGIQGGGARYITVLWCEKSPYVLGEQAEEAQRASA